MSDVVKLTSNVIKSGSTLQHMAGEIVDLTGFGLFGNTEEPSQGPPLAESLIKRGLAVASDEKPTHSWNEGEEGSIRGGKLLEGATSQVKTVESTQSLARTPKAAVDPNEEGEGTESAPLEKGQPLSSESQAAQGQSVAQANAQANAQPSAAEVAATASQVK